jgi:hypothetical protein
MEDSFRYWQDKTCMIYGFCLQCNKFPVIISPVYNGRSFLNIFVVTKYICDRGSCETETCRVIVGGHEIGAVEPGTAWSAALKTVFVYK